MTLYFLTRFCFPSVCVKSPSPPDVSLGRIGYGLEFRMWKSTTLNGSSPNIETSWGLRWVETIWVAYCRSWIEQTSKLEGQYYKEVNNQNNTLFDGPFCSFLNILKMPTFLWCFQIGWRRFTLWHSAWWPQIFPLSSHYLITIITL